ncbi:hypothetical protein N431DRAFT_474255 [Stipitochalara longipes BDJ]|nr:hypothetical protein N431DRAFT_474255 [Stipitochalara longipes BDJ]
MPAGARRPHRKTRNGCLGCKARRIKCDEVKPSCGTCTRYSSSCTYPTTLSASHSTSGSPSSTLIPQSHHQDRPPTSLYPPPQSSLLLSPFNTQHLELLHLYTTTTAYTLTTLPARARIYQHIIPQLAFSHPFLLSGILSLSSLHLSHLYPSRKEPLHRDAVEYHSFALRGFKEELGKLNRENYEALFMFSTFLVARTWASGEGRGDLFFSDGEREEEGIVEWMRFLRGSRMLVRDCYDWIMAGPCKIFVLLYNDQPQFFDLPEEDAVRFGVLETLWDSQSTFDPAEKEALSEALRILKEIYAMLLHYGSASQQLCTINMTIAWLTLTPDMYMELVSQRRPEALVLLAHYCLLLSKFDNVWWLKGISRHLLRSICRMLGKVDSEVEGSGVEGGGAGKGKWESWVAWPLQELVLNEFRGTGEEMKFGLMREENRVRVMRG